MTTKSEKQRAANNFGQAVAHMVNTLMNPLPTPKDRFTFVLQVEVSCAECDTALIFGPLKLTDLNPPELYPLLDQINERLRNLGWTGTPVCPKHATAIAK